MIQVEVREVGLSCGPWRLWSRVGFHCACSRKPLETLPGVCASVYFAPSGCLVWNDLWEQDVGRSGHRDTAKRKVS